MPKCEHYWILEMTKPHIVATDKSTVKTSYRAWMSCTKCGKRRNMTAEEEDHLKKTVRQQTDKVLKQHLGIEPEKVGCDENICNG
jgi:hypothetical protein